MRRLRYLVVLLVVLLGLAFFRPRAETAGSDWPQWRHDAHRSAASPVELPAELRLQWKRELPPPQPAFPYDVRLCFDTTYEPVAMGKLLFVPSMVTDSVAAYDTDTGAVRWRFFAEGPVRFAPVAWGGNVYFVSDDGYLYCVDARDGALRWRVRGAPPRWKERKLLGNNRMVSRWPARGGPVLADGRIFFAAGFWSNEGTYVCAVDAQTGRVLWRNETGSFVDTGLNDHGGRWYGGLTPQGYLAVIGGKLVVPNGRALPAFFDLRTGEMEPFTSGWGGRYGLAKGSWWVCGTGKYFFVSGDMFAASPDAARVLASKAPEPLTPEQFARLAELPLETVQKWVKEKKLKTITQEGRVLIRPYKPGGTTFLWWGSRNLPASEELWLRARPRLQIEPMNQDEVGVFREPILTETAMFYSRPARWVRFPQDAQYSQLVAYDLTRPKRGLAVTQFYGGTPLIVWPVVRFENLWSLPTDLKAFLKAGSRLYCGAKGVVAAVQVPQRGERPRVVWQARVEGTPATMLAADGKLFVVTREGGLYCFGSGAAAPRTYVAKSATPAAVGEKWKTMAQRIAAHAAVKNGYCLVLGLGSGQLVRALAQHSRLQLIVLERDARKVLSARREFFDSGLYGERVHVLQGALGSLELPPYFASVVASETADAFVGEGAGEFVRRVYRCLRPYGGTACLPLSAAWHEELARATVALKLPGCQVMRDGALSVLIRAGALPGAADWSHVTGSAGNTYSSLDSAARPPFGLLWFGGSLHNVLHWRENFTCTVAAGRMFLTWPGELYAIDAYTGREIWRRSVRMNPNTIVALPDAVYAVNGGLILRLNPETGETAAQYKVPSAAPGEGWTALLRVWRDYIVNATTARRIVCMNRQTGRAVWSKKYERDGLHFVLGSGRVYCAEYWWPAHARRGEQKQEQPRLFALDIRTGKQLWERSFKLPAASEPEDWRRQFRPLNPVLSYSEPDDVVLVTAVYYTISAYRGRDGAELWRQIVRIEERPSPYSAPRPPVVLPGLLNPQSGALFNLPTGRKLAMRLWQFTTNAGTRGCGRAVGSARLVTVRDAHASLFDLQTGCEVQFRGVRAACNFNIIPADGLVLAPYKSFHCKCNYGIRISFAAAHMPEAAQWFHAASRGAENRLRLDAHPGEAVRFRLVATNLSERVLRDEIQLELPVGWRAEPAQLSVRLAAGKATAYNVTLRVPKAAKPSAQRVKIRAQSEAIVLAPSLVEVYVSKPKKPIEVKVKAGLNHSGEFEVTVEVLNQSGHERAGTVQVEMPAGWARRRGEFRFSALSPGEARKFVFNAGRPAASASRHGEKIAVVVRLGGEEIRQYARPPVVVPRLASDPPKIDGRLDDRCWREGAQASEFVDAQSNQPAPLQSVLYLTYDRTRLYLGMSCPDPSPSELKALVTKHDGEVWTDDSVEVFLDTNCDRRTYYQFITNARGVSFEGFDLDMGKWDCAWDAKTSVNARGWAVEMAIPFASLRTPTPEPGTVWCFNVVRNFRGAHTTQLFCTYGFNHRPERFGQLLFSR